MYQVIGIEEVVRLTHEFRKELIAKFKEHSFKEGDFTLSSGKKSKYYFNVKNAYVYPEIMEMISTLMMFKFNPMECCDYIGGVELGAIPLVTALSMKVHKPFIMIRKNVKDYGTKSEIEGTLKSGSTVLMVEDVTTTGGSVIKGIEAIHRASGICPVVMTVVDRGEGAYEKLKAMDVELVSLFKIEDFISETSD